VSEILLSNHESGQALIGGSMKAKQWFSLDLKTQSELIRIIKTEEEELSDLYDLYYDLEEMLNIYFVFRVEFLEASKEE
jgi:hypothetical protein